MLLVQIDSFVRNFALAALLTLTFNAWSAADLKQLQMPAGFKIEVYAEAEGARSLAKGPNGIVFVGNKDGNQLYALTPDKNKDGRADDVVKIEGLKAPNGVAFKDGDLYAAEISQVYRYKNIEANLAKPGKPEKFGPKFPTDAHHGWKYIAFGPDGWLYVPVGAPCNICDRDLKTYAAIHRVSPDGSKRELVAQGVRNTVGFDWHPVTKEMWFSDNGRDMMGDDIPPCELNRLEKVGQNFGYPYCHGGSVLDPKFGKGKKCEDFTKPVFEFGAHRAPLGMRFITKNPKLKGSILVAEHGSWNRSSPVGYQVTKNYRFRGKTRQGRGLFDRFLEERPRSVVGPVDILELDDGSILISDDGNGAIYRLTN